MNVGGGMSCEELGQKSMVQAMKKHGSYSIEREQNILTIRIYDAWNVETSNELWKKIIVIGERFNGKPWAILCDLRKWGLSTPESVAMGPEVTASLDRLGRTHTAMIFGDQILVRDTAEYAFDAEQRKATLNFLIPRRHLWVQSVEGGASRQ